MVGKYVTVVALVLILLLSGTSPFAVTSFAQMSASCSREMARQDAALRQFDADVKQESLGFLADDAGRALMNAVQAKLGDVTADALESAQDSYEKFVQWLNSKDGIKTLLNNLKQCIDAGMSGCWKRVTENGLDRSGLAGKARDGLNKWIDSLGNETISGAAAKVERASSIVQNLHTQAGNVATGAASGAMQNCFREMEQRVEARSNNPVNLRSQPGTQLPALQPPAAGNSGASSADSGGGPGAGTVAAITVTAAATGAGLWMLSEADKKARCDLHKTEMDIRANATVNASNALASCGSNINCINTRLNAVNSAISAMLTTAGNWCACLGPSAASELSSADKAALRDALNAGRALGINAGTLPACFR